MIKELLDLQSKKKVDIIEKIFNTKNHSCTQARLLKELKMTYPTLRNLIETINYDAKLFGFENFSITHSPPNQLYTLEMDEESNIQMVIHSYIRQTTKFRLLELLLTTSFATIQVVADRLFISYTSIRKDIKELNKLLEPYCITISTSNGIYLEGEEMGIRMFYSMIFLTVFGGESWPFLFIRYSEISELLEKCPKEIYNARSFDKSIAIHFYIAIHLLRVRQNNPVLPSQLHNVPIYKPYSDRSKQSFHSFVAQLKSYLPNLNEQKLIFSSRIILSVITAFGSYSSIKKVPTFFYSEPLLTKNDFFTTAIAICEKVNNHLSVPFSETEKENLLYSLMSVNYRYLLFKKIDLCLEPIILGYSKIDRDIRKRHKVRHLELLINRMMNLEEFSVLNAHKQELAADYLIIFEKRIDFSKHTKTINVAVLSIISNETSVANFMNYFSNYYNVCVKDGWNSRTDLIICDFPLSEHVQASFGINQPIVYVHTRWSGSDYEKINKALARIAIDKFVNNV